MTQSPSTFAQTDLLCPTCAGQRHYSPETVSLDCGSCGRSEPIIPPDDHNAGAEYALDDDVPQVELSQDEPEVHQCRTCGGEVIFTGAALSDHCPYCDGAVVLKPGDPSFATMALIPFQVTEAKALEAARRWIAGRWAAPDDLAAAFEKGRMSGLYAPFWTFDSREAVQYWAKVTTGSGDRRRTRRISGNMNIFFNDLLVPASAHVTPLIRDGILHYFNPNALVPYAAPYLAGFAAERHHQTVAEGLAANADDKALLIRNRIRGHIRTSGRISNIGYKTDTTGIHYRRILLPVWILHYRYGGRAKKVVVSGIDGRAFGERPFSFWKLAGYSALLSAAALAAGVLYGLAGMP